MKIYDIKIRNRLLISFLIIELIFIITGLFALKEYNELSNLTNKIYKHPLAVSNTVRDIKANILAMHRSMKDVVLAMDKEQLNTARNIVDEYEKQVFDEFDLVSKRFLGNRASVENAEKAFSDWNLIRDEIILLVQAGKKNEAAQITKGKGAKHVRYMNEKNQVMIDFASQKAKSFLADVQGSSDNAVTNIIGLIVFAVFVGIIISLIITKSIGTPLNAIIENTKEISQGNLDKKLKYHSKDEIGEFADHFRNMQTDLKNAIYELKYNEKRFRSITETATDAITTINNNKIVQWNHAAEVSFGYNADEIIGKPMTTIIPKTFWMLIKQGLKNSMKHIQEL